VAYTSWTASSSRATLFQPFFLDLTQLGVGDLEMTSDLLARFRDAQVATVLRRDKGEENLAAFRDS
jgi:hypothetical protein